MVTKASVVRRHHWVGMRERQAHTRGRGCLLGERCAKAPRHEHSQGAREMLERPGGRGGAEAAESMVCEQGLMAPGWTLGLILSSEGAMRRFEWGLMTAETLSVDNKYGGPTGMLWHGTGEETDRTWDGLRTK